jgi:phosphonate degradation associated HDIG domain protein
MTETAPETLDAIFALYAAHGGESYGEDVTQVAHALQCAHAAEAAGADAALVTAALLHDVGHLLHRDGGAALAAHRDDRHEALGATALARLFVPEVVRPVALHVAAKRYLCHADPRYGEALSSASRRSLELQGGPMDAEEAAAFVRDPHAEAAIALRRWDEAAKVPDLETPPLTHYRAIAASCLKPV